MQRFFRCLYYLILNNIVNSIPSWTIRRIIYRMCGMKIGKGSRIMLHVIVYQPRSIVIGNSSIVNSYALIDGRGGLEIGNNVNVSMYAIIYSASHKSYSKTFEYYTKKTTIEDCCWIGARAVIMPGTMFRRNSILSVNSVFSGESNIAGVYVGVPAEMVKKRTFEDSYEENCVHKYWFE